jgi:tetratricopeptide (TPR) repeat protein
MTEAFKKLERLLMSGRRVLFAALLLVLFFHPSRAEEIARGVVLERVACQETSGQTYALFLPSSYSTGKRWPVVYAFDPAARGRVPVERFKEAAEKYGYIIVGSNNSRNGPVKASIEAFDAMWRDTHARFAIDDERVYTTGFSGGARVASLAATLCEKCVAGVIACGAGFNQAYPPTKSTRFAVFATVGVDDFNYPELAELGVQLERNGIPHRVATFEGGHAWPPAELCDEALLWMELQAMQRGRKAKDEALVRDSFDKAMERARALSEQKKFYEAYALYQSLAESYKGLIETTAVESKAAELKASREVKERIKEERSQLERQRALGAEVVRLAQLLNNADERNNALADLRRLLADLRKKGEAAEDTGERRVARRTLRQAFAQFYEGGTIEYAKDRQAARQQLEVAAEVAPREAAVFYQLAILYAQGGEKRKALDALRRSVENGLKDPALIEGNKELARLRDEAEYRKIIDTLKTK